MGIIGIDEVGRGAWAGPLVFAGVSLPKNCSFISDLKDSKLLSYSKRVYLSKLIQENSVFYIASVESDEIDKIGLTAASAKACVEILNNMSYEMNIEKVILDGNVNYLKSSLYSPLTDVIPKADMNIHEVMAASIIAKNFRDKIMHEYENIYPGYGFINNVGYGTAKHKEALDKLGILPIHRRSFKPIAT